VRGIAATFTGDPTATTFTVNGLQPDRAAALLGAGITAQFTPVWKAFVNYDADLRGNEVATGGPRGATKVFHQAA